MLNRLDVKDPRNIVNPREQNYQPANACWNHHVERNVEMFVVHKRDLTEFCN